MLGSGVGSGEWDAEFSRHAGDEGKGSSALLVKDGNEEPGQVDDGEDVEIEEVLVDLQIGILPTGALRSAGVVHHHVHLKG